MKRTVSSTMISPVARTSQSSEALGGVLLAGGDASVRHRLGQMVARYRRSRQAHSHAQSLALLDAHTDWCGFIIAAEFEGSRGLVLELVATVRERWPAVPSVVVCDHVDRELVNGAAALGTPILVNPFGETELRPFLERVIAYERSFADAFAERLALSTRIWKLSLREHEILAWHLAGGTREDYLATSGLSEGTLKTYVKRMLKKVGAQNLAEMTQVTFRRVLGTPSPLAAPAEEASDRDTAPPIPLRR